MANTNGLLIAFKNIVTLAENPTRMAKHIPVIAEVR